MKTRCTSYVFIFAMGLCATQAAELDAHQRRHRPRIRIASTPYPNILFRSLKTPEFGEHHYEPSRRLFGPREVSRGHAYTRRGGFIDLAHLRKTVDWAAYLQSRIRQELALGRSEMSFRCSEPSRYHIRIQYPAAVASMSEAMQDELRDALSVELALTLSYTALIWHEMLTWYGYSASQVLSEKQSAFSYEDMYTHAVGIAVAKTALQDDSQNYDKAVQVALKAEMQRLGCGNRTATRAALSVVHKRWWRYNRGLKRYTEIGTTAPLQPWLVVGDASVSPVGYAAPSLSNVAGFDFRDRVEIRLEPVVRQGDRVLAALGRAKGPIIPRDDFPLIMTAIRKEMIAIHGEAVLDPDLPAEQHQADHDPKQAQGRPDERMLPIQ